MALSGKNGCDDFWEEAVVEPSYISAICKVHNWHGTLSLP